MLPGPLHRVLEPRLPLRPDVPPHRLLIGRNVEHKRRNASDSALEEGKGGRPPAMIPSFNAQSGGLETVASLNQDAHLHDPITGRVEVGLA